MIDFNLLLLLSNTPGKNQLRHRNEPIAAENRGRNLRTGGGRVGKSSRVGLNKVKFVKSLVGRGKVFRDKRQVVRTKSQRARSGKERNKAW